MCTPTRSRSARHVSDSKLAIAAWLIAFVCWASPAWAHPLSFGSVRLERVEEVVEGDLVLDVPEVVQQKPDELRRSELTDQVRAGLVLETERGRITPRVKVRELGHGSQAVDVAEVSYVLPRDTQRLRFVTSTAIGDVAVELVDPLVQLRERTVVPAGDTSRWVELVPALAQPAASAMGPDPAPAPERVAKSPWASSESRSFVDYTQLGLRHIVPEGVDHLLFVASLVLLVEGWTALIVLLSVFTLGHTLSVASTLFGGPSLAPSWVEPLIALSLAYAALEDVRPRWARFRLAVAATFGLVHGLGFASALGQVRVPEGERVLALLGFNLGVEVGQVLFAGLVLGILALLRTRVDLAKARRFSVRAIAGVGLAWAALRVLGG